MTPPRAKHEKYIRREIIMLKLEYLNESNKYLLLIKKLSNFNFNFQVITNILNFKNLRHLSPRNGSI